MADRLTMTSDKGGVALTFDLMVDNINDKAGEQE